MKATKIMAIFLVLQTLAAFKTSQHSAAFDSHGQIFADHASVNTSNVKCNNWCLKCKNGKKALVRRGASQRGLGAAAGVGYLGGPLLSAVVQSINVAAAGCPHVTFRVHEHGEPVDKVSWFTLSKAELEAQETMPLWSTGNISDSFIDPDEKNGCKQIAESWNGFDGRLAGDEEIQQCMKHEALCGDGGIDSIEVFRTKMFYQDWWCWGETFSWR